MAASFLIIQTAFIGDVILATGVIEKLKKHYPDARIDFMVRKGNEGIVKDHPYLNTVYIWDKKGGKYKNLWKILKQVRHRKYSYVINLQRYATTGWFTVFSGADTTIGFDKNPLSRFFDKAVPHVFDGKHEIERNHTLIQDLTDTIPGKPRLYPAVVDFEIVAPCKKQPYICIAPTSVWFTKQFPEDKWMELIQQLSNTYSVYLLGAPTDWDICENIRVSSQQGNVYNLAGKLSLLASAALMQDAVMNYVNDSAPMHLSSAMNAPVCAVYCSTIPGFGYGPLSDRSFVIEVEEKLACRPCGLHGHKACPEGHFKCARNIEIRQLRVGQVDSSV
ncbi:glycosyltransferase family 9 protein [Xanthocytophaga agilis]|uniref:Glycosyltransferase family 9 protein n=1 Tax=Xanthocytophaga agilis TaxID=3048010 RepID=A0AAE3R5Z7_9BACT|nr:glycosyltransferase family 9 protein [Xanthocytophaga agilis]MDJ1502227.1 glycosyltransferase family 9 protein [Xanthocytophaga agilis]